MNYFDLILAIPLVWGAINGFRKGLIIEVSSLIALVLGLYGAMEFSSFLAEMFQENLDWSPQLIHWLAFLTIFILIVVLINFLAKGIQKLAKMAALGTINRIFGLLFGLTKYLLLISALLYLINKVDRRYPFISEDFKEGSFLYKPLSAMVPTFYPKLEEAVAEKKTSLEWP